MINPKLIAFAKTPGLTAVKTRLAKTRGVEFAETLYRLCLECTAEVLKQTRDQIKESEVCFALAEKSQQTEAYWLDPVLLLGPVQSQAKGGLGEKLHYAYAKNLEPGNCVGLLGTDLPQLSSSFILNALKKVNENADFVIGPSRDGGFYFLLGRKEIPKEVWTSVEYSQADTRTQLVTKLKDLGVIEELAILTDIDEDSDLTYARDELYLLQEQNELLPAQTRFLKFLEQNI